MSSTSRRAASVTSTVSPSTRSVPPRRSSSGRSPSGISPPLSPVQRTGRAQKRETAATRAATARRCRALRRPVRPAALRLALVSAQRCSQPRAYRAACVGGSPSPRRKAWSRKRRVTGLLASGPASRRSTSARKASASIPLVTAASATSLRRRGASS